MDAVTQGQVALGVAPHVEAIGIFELALVAVRGGPHQQHAGALGDALAVQFHVACGAARQGLGGRLETQHLLYGGGNARGLAGQQRALLGVLGEQRHAVADETGHRYYSLRSSSKSAYEH